MTAKEYLGRAYLLNARIETKVRQLDALNDMATHITSTIDDMPKAPLGETSKLEDTVVKIVELQRLINKKIDELVDLKAEIMEVIDMVPDEAERVVLESRYVNLDTWNEMSDRLHICKRRLYQIHGNALCVVDGILEKREELKECS